jgi:predicted phosphodiesterase
MRALILSDIHANLEALEAVLHAAAGQWDELWNLGDLVGYGGAPNQVIDLIRPLQTVVVRGNHDRVCCGLTSPNAFNPVARDAALWTRAELTQTNLEWLKEVQQGPINPAHEGISCAHGSPLDEDRYILSMRDAWAPLQQSATPLTFFGHTHIQGGFAQNDNTWHELRPAISHPRFVPPQPPSQTASKLQSRSRRFGDLANRAESWTLTLPPGSRHLINPGSVGQPRDFDWRAAFAILTIAPSETDPGASVRQIAFHRVPYDVVSSQGRILMAGLPERLASRLREGR